MKLYDILMSDDVVESIRNNTSFLVEILPQIKYMFHFDQKHPHHHLDVWEHTLLALSMSDKDFEIRLALLLHDIGKPFSYQDGEVRHFCNHANVSSNMAKEMLKKLDLDEIFVNEVSLLIKYHDTPLFDVKEPNTLEFYNKLYKIQYCDAMAHNPNKLEKRIKYLNETKIKLMKYTNK